jgi:membrane associated rhomboid family serine protease
LSRLLPLGDPRRRAAAPYGWRNIAAPLARQGSGRRLGASETRINGWLLVCAARKIPHRILPRGTASRLYVPALYERIALQEITAFERERPPVFTRTPAREHSGLILCFFLLLLGWHGLRFHWPVSVALSSPPFPVLPAAWAEGFGLDIFKVWFSGEWWRCATALTLHTDGAHLAGNLVFGLFFSLPLCRRIGTGLGLLMIIMAGILGNAGNVAFRDAPMISMGFSTALFGAVGGLCALTGADALRGPFAADGLHPSLSGPRFSRLFFSIAAGLALLGFLGGGAEARTDYTAHIAGFCAGLLLAVPVFPLDAFLRGLSPRRETAAQAFLGLLALLVLCLAWGYALLISQL